MRYLRALLVPTVAAVLIGYVSPHAHAQRIPPIREGRPVRVQLDNAVRVEGRFVRATDTSLHIRLPSTELPNAIIEVRAANIDRLWVRGHSASAGAFFGGSLAAGAWVALIVGWCSSFDCSDANWTAAMGAALAAAAGGAGLGALIGRAIPRWSQRDLGPPALVAHDLTRQRMRVPAVPRRLNIAWSIRF